MCSAPRLRVKGASSPQVLRERALAGRGRSGLRAKSRLESPGEGCLVGLGLPGRGRIRSSRHRQVYQPLAGGHQAPCPGSVRIRQEPGRQKGCLAGGSGKGRCGEHVWLGEGEFRQSLPSLAASPSRAPGPIAACAAFHTHTLRARTPDPVKSPGGLPTASAAPAQHALGLFTLGARCPPPSSWQRWPQGLSAHGRHADPARASGDHRRTELSFSPRCLKSCGC